MFRHVTQDTMTIEDENTVEPIEIELLPRFGGALAIVVFNAAQVDGYEPIPKCTRSRRGAAGWPVRCGRRRDGPAS